MSFFSKWWELYSEGFKNLGPTGKKLWIIIIIKLFIMFAILKVFFFPDILEKNFSTDKERTNYIIKQITKQ